MQIKIKIKIKIKMNEWMNSREIQNIKNAIEMHTQMCSSD